MRRIPIGGFSAVLAVSSLFLMMFLLIITVENIKSKQNEQNILRTPRIYYDYEIRFVAAGAKGRHKISFVDGVKHVVPEILCPVASREHLSGCEKEFVS